MFDTREAWLNAACAKMAPWFDEAGKPLPSPVRVSIGFPSRGALSLKRRTIGECWSVETSADQTAEIFISPLLDDVVEIAATLLHEMAHAVLGPKVGHKKPFAKLVFKLGLEGKATAPVAGEAFKSRVEPIIEALGPLPHAKLTPMVKQKKQGTRMIKCECEECGYTVRTTKKWLEVAMPECPVDRVTLTCDEPEEEDGE